MANKPYEVNHYEDIIGIELQQALEKMLKIYGIIRKMTLEEF